MNPATIESLASALESIATVAALAAAGWWTFRLFVQKREKYPRARTTHNLALLGGVGGHRLLRLTVKLENLGSVLIELCSGKVLVQCVRPTPDAWAAAILRGDALPRVDGHELPWPILEEITLNWGDDGYRIEPLESDELHFDLALASTIEAVQIYTYFKNVTEKRRELGWNCTTIQNVPKGDECAEQTAETARAQTAATSEVPHSATRTAEGRYQTGATEARSTKTGG